MVVGLRGHWVQGSSSSRAWDALTSPTDLGCDHSALYAVLFYCFLLLLEMCTVKDVCSASLLGYKATFPHVRNSSRDSHVPVDTNPNKEGVLPLPFPYFLTNLCFHPQKFMTKNWFSSEPEPVSVILGHDCRVCSFLKAGLCITNPGWGLTYTYICLVFMLIEEFLFPGYLVSSQKKFE